MFTLFRCFTEACETYEGDPIPEKLYQQPLGFWDSAASMRGMAGNSM